MPAYYLVRVVGCVDPEIVQTFDKADEYQSLVTTAAKLYEKMDSATDCMFYIDNTGEELAVRSFANFEIEGNH